MYGVATQVAISHRKQNTTQIHVFNSLRIARHAVMQGARPAFLPQGAMEKSTTENKNKTKNKNKNNYKYTNSLDLPTL